MKRFSEILKKTLHYIPALLILICGMVALDATQQMKAANDVLEAYYKLHSLHEHQHSSHGSSPDEARMERRIERLNNIETWLYWSVLMIGFAGFLLFILNTDKIRKIEKAHKDHKEAAEKAAREQEKVQDQLNQAQKMEAVGRLAGGIAHDFNNILAAMNGYAEFLSEDLKEGSAQHGFAQNILKAGHQARQLVDQMLAFSRSKPNTMQNTDLNAPMKESIAMLSASIPKSIVLETDIDPNEDFVINGNPTQITQVIMNLCVNARDAMEGSTGKLRLSLRPFNPGEQAPLNLLVEELPDPKATPPIIIEEIGADHARLHLGNLASGVSYVCLIVEDTGSGIPMPIMQKMFEPFFTSKPVEKGTGLGLSTVHGVVTAHRGAMKVDSTIGSGTRFELYFPCAVEDTAVDSIEENVNIDTISAHILLVEDQADVREMTSARLKRLGHDVQGVENGLEALDALRENPNMYDLVITDQNMPKMTGLELVYQANMDFPDLPFILLSGYSTEALYDMMQEHEAIKAFIHKPVKRDELAHQIAKVLIENKTAKAA